MGKIKNGFTLMEVLIYVALFAVVGSLLAGILLVVSQIRQRESAAAEVTGQLNFVTQTINRLVRESSNIEIEVGTPVSVLKLRMPDPAKDPTCISLVDGIIKLAEGPASNSNECTAETSDLTNDRVIVNTLTFKKFVQYPGHDTVSVDITMTYNTDNPRGQIQKTLSSAIGRISAATFDSNLVPGSDAYYDIGYSGTRWRNGAFSGDLVVAGSIGIGVSNPSYQLQLSTDSAAKPSTNTWTVASDARIKNIVGLYNRGLKEIMQINPTVYTYKIDNALGIVDPGQHIGIVAQEIEKIIPEAISVDSRGYLHFTADPVNWAMVNAIKELKSENDALKKIICLDHPGEEFCRW